MNFLALVNRTRRECGASSAALASFTSLSVEDTRFKDWVATAWQDLQMHRDDWQWMRDSTSFTTTADQYSYTPTQAGASDAANWKRDSFRAYTTASGVADEQILPFMDYDTFRNVYQFGAMTTTTGRPVVFSVVPGTKSLVIGPVPTAGYTVAGEYYRAPTELSATTDDPSSAGNGLETRWHMLLVYMAMQSYAHFEAAPEVLQRADAGVKRLLNHLEFDQMPAMTFGPPLG